MHQAAINQGNWEIAALLVPTEDPLGRVEFGGDHEEMRQIQSHRRAMRDLRTSMNRGLAEEAPAEGEVRSRPPKGKAKAKSKSGE